MIDYCSPESKHDKLNNGDIELLQDFLQESVLFNERA
jgi:hypothetical protein